MPVVADRTKETTNTTGTGALTLSGAVVGFRSFNSAVGVGVSVYYALLDANGVGWETGNGQLSSSTVFVRTTVSKSSNANAAISLSAGTHTLFSSLIESWAATKLDTPIVDLTTTGNTILGDASTDTLNVGNGGIIKDASGNVGIGGTPVRPLDLFFNSSAYSATGDAAMRLVNANSGGQNIVDFVINGTLRGRVRADYVGNLTHVANGGVHSFYTGGDAGAGTERMSIDQSGIKTEAPNGAAASWKLGSVTAGTALVLSATSYVEVKIGASVVKLAIAV